MSSLVTSRREDDVLFVALARPEKRNAINHAMLDELAVAVGEADRDRGIRAVIVHGEGPVFSAGVDLGGLAGNAGGEDRMSFRRRVGGMQAVLTSLEMLETPVIAAVHRFAAGLALELALACDVRIVTDDAQLGLPEVRLGLVPDVGGTTRLVRTVGYAKAKELIMTGRMIPAAEALRIGLVNEVVPAGEHLAAATRIAREMAANAPLAVGLAKRLVDLGSQVDAQTFLQMELLTQSLLKGTADAREGTAAAAERRPPRFTGR